MQPLACNGLSVVKEDFFSRQTCSYEMKSASNITEEDHRGSYYNYY